MQPFSITLFATTGDPEGIRHVDKSNWSGYGVVFTRLPSGWHATRLRPTWKVDASACHGVKTAGAPMCEPR